MNFSVAFILITSLFLLIDTLFSLYNFKYIYFIELKRRYAQQKHIPWRYKQKLDIEILKESGGHLRGLIQSLYLPWCCFCLILNFWFLPVITSIVMVLTNLIYKKPYISPLMLILNLVIFFMVYLFTILTLISRFV